MAINMRSTELLRVRNTLPPPLSPTLSEGRRVPTRIKFDMAGFREAYLVVFTMETLENRRVDILLSFVTAGVNILATVRLTFPVR